MATPKQPIVGPLFMADIAQTHPQKLKIAGVYIWGVQWQGRLFALAIGQTRNLQATVWEQWVQLRGGGYSLFEWDTLTNPNRKLASIRYAHELKCKSALKKSKQYVTYPAVNAPLLYYANRNWNELPKLNTHMINDLIEKLYENWFICWVREEDPKLREEMLRKQAIFIGNEKLMHSEVSGSELYAAENYFGNIELA